MREHILESGNFRLCLSLNVFESDIGFPINTHMAVSVTCSGFSAESDMDIDIRDFAGFSMKLMAVYKTLKGEAAIREPYGHEKYIAFTADRTGHIAVKGYLCDDSRSNELRFETVFDQTYLKAFAEEIALTYSGYTEHQ